MTTTTSKTDATDTAALARMTENLSKVEALGARLTQILIGREGHQSSLDAPNQELFAKAAQSYWSEAVQNPAKLIEHQVSFWSKSVGPRTPDLPTHYGAPIRISTLSNSNTLSMPKP